VKRAFRLVLSAGFHGLSPLVKCDALSEPESDNGGRNKSVQLDMLAAE
jgi:hypothetical protein